MNKRHRISEPDAYKIKVNKKGSHNSISSINKIPINNNNLNSAKLYKINTHIPCFQSAKSSFKFEDKSMTSPYSNNRIINTKIIKCKNNSNSEEKIRKNDINMNNIYDNNGNILEDLMNNKYLKPILECQDIDEKLYHCNLKEPIKNNFNVSLNDFFNRKRKNCINYKTPKLENNKIPHGLSINTHNTTNDNYINNDLMTQNNRTFESNEYNTNNYYNDIQLTNNYYNNNEINFVNFSSYNNDMSNFLSEGKKLNNYSYTGNSPLIYYSYENKNLYKNNTYINNRVNNSNEIYYLNGDNNSTYNQNSNYSNNSNIDYNRYSPLPLNNYVKSQTYTQKKDKTNLNNYTNYRPKKQCFNNKEINIRKNIGNIATIGRDPGNSSMQETFEYKNNQYDKIKNIIKQNNNIKQNKYNYNKKLFDIYLGKLVNEFIRNVSKVINRHLHNNLKIFFDSLKNRRSTKNKIDEIFIPKIYIEKTNNNVNKNDNSYIQGSSKSKKQKYCRIFNSDKKYSQINNNNINLLNLSELNLGSKKRKTMNNSFIINKEKKDDIIIKTDKNINELNNNKKNNTSIINTNRQLLLTDNTNKASPSNNSINNNNIKIIDNNKSLNPYIYIKKVKLSKNIRFANKSNKMSNSRKKEINREDILSNSKGKIIDIDINLGKSIKEISDISPLENMFINNYKNKKYKTSLSTNKREKKKRKNRSKNKKYSLPKKKFAEEIYDSFPIRNEDIDLDDMPYYIKNNSFDNKLNNPINLNNSYNLNNKYFKTFIKDDNDFNNIPDIENIENKSPKKNYKNILVKNIVTLDKRLYIHINYIFSISMTNSLKNKNKKYENDVLIIKRNIIFSIIMKNSNNAYNRHKKKNLVTNTRNFNNIFENKKSNKTNYLKYSKDKYLFSCVKFLIKSINKVFLNKAYKYFLNSVEEKCKNNKKKIDNKFRINTYKKKISRGKI